MALMLLRSATRRESRERRQLHTPAFLLLLTTRVGACIYKNMYILVT
jgi:hypothetical protein